MAFIQATDPTTVTTVNDLFYNQYISMLTRDVASEPIIGYEFVNAVLVPSDGASYTYSVDTWNELDNASAVADNDAAAEDSLTTDQVGAIETKDVQSLTSSQRCGNASDRRRRRLRRSGGRSNGDMDAISRARARAGRPAGARSRPW